MNTQPESPRLIGRRGGTVPIIVQLVCTLFAVNVSAQESDPALQVFGDQSVDNPKERVEFERLRRADPATGRIPEGIRGRELVFASTLPVRSDLAVENPKVADLLGASPVRWTERGPFGQGGRTRALAFDLDDPSVILAGAVSGGMWRSTDTGRSWTRVTDIDDIHSVTCLAQDPRPGSRHVWYYGTGEQRANSANLPGDGIFKSTDGGRSWKQLPSTVRNTPQSRDQMFDYVHQVVVDPTSQNDDIVYAACYGGIARSTDGGDSWAPVLGDVENNASYSDVAVAGDGTLYATISSNGRQVQGIYRSEDGLDWTEITPAEFPASYGKVSIGIAPSNENVVYFFGKTNGTGPNGHSLWRYHHSNDVGSTWEDRTSGLLYTTESYSSYCIVVRVHPNDENIVYAGHVQFHRSTNGFADSSETRNFMGAGQHADQHSIAFSPKDADVMLAGHDGGVSITDNAAGTPIRWNSLNNGYATTQFYSIAIDPVSDGSSDIVGGTQDNGSWFTNDSRSEADWNKIFGADGGFCAIADSGTSVYTSYQRGRLFRSMIAPDGSRANWARIDPVGGESYFFIHPFSLDPSDTRIMYLPEGRDMWRNSDLTEIELDRSGNKKSKNWEKLENVRTRFPNEQISAVGVSRNNPAHRLYYGTTRGSIMRVDEAHIGDPDDEDVTTLEMPSSYINCIAVDPQNGNHAVAVFSSYNVHSLYATYDGGESWAPVGGNLEENHDGTGNGPSVSWCSILPVNGNRYYVVGTTVGLFSALRLDGMKTVWAREGERTIGNVVVDMIASRESDGFVAVGTHGRGVYSANVKSALIESTLKISTGAINFGEVPIGFTVSDTLVLSNSTGSARPVRGSLSLGNGPFTAGDTDSAFEISPGDELRIPIWFSPTDAELYSTPLYVYHDATTPQQTSKVWLIGTGVSTSGIDDVDETDPVVGVTVFAQPSVVVEEGIISIIVAKAMPVRVSLIDERGVEVAELLDRTLHAGSTRVRIQSGEFAQGQYLVRCETEEGTVVEQVVLL